MGPCNFDTLTLFTKNVPHILENIFLSLDYDFYKKCFKVKVNSAWYKLLFSELFQRKAKSVFCNGILKDNENLITHASRGSTEEVQRLLSNVSGTGGCKLHGK